MKSSDFSTNAELSIHRVELSQVGLLSGSSYILDNFSFFFFLGLKFLFWLIIGSGMIAGGVLLDHCHGSFSIYACKSALMHGSSFEVWLLNLSCLLLNLKILWSDVFSNG